MSNVATLSNGLDTLRREYLADVAKDGGLSGKGKNAWPNVLLRTVSAARDGIITTDDAMPIFETFARAEGKALVHDRPKDSVKKTKSELVKMIEMGALVNVDAVDVMSRAVTLYGNLKEEGAELKAAYTGYMQVVRDQLKSPDYALDDDAITHALLKGEGKPATVETKLKQALAALEAAVKLNDADENPLDLSSVTKAASLVQSTLSYMATSAERRALLAKLAILDSKAA